MIKHRDFIFCHMPRTGGCFVRDLLNENIAGSKRTRRNHIALENLEDSEINKFKFGTIRNPYDWYVSWWAYSKYSPVDQYTRQLYSNGGTEDFNIFVKNVMEANEGKNTWFNLNIMGKFDIGLMTYKYLNVLCSRNKVFDKELCMWEQSHDELLLADYIMRFEALRDEIDYVFSTYIFDLDSNQRKKLFGEEKINSSNRKADYRKYYSDESIELIKHKDRFIFNNYDYSF